MFELKPPNSQSSLSFILPADLRHEDSSDDNHSSLGRSAPSDDLSVASDYQEDTAPECEFEPVDMFVFVYKYYKRLLI